MPNAAGSFIILALSASLHINQATMNERLKRIYMCPNEIKIVKECIENEYAHLNHRIIDSFFFIIQVKRLYIKLIIV